MAIHFFVFSGMWGGEFASRCETGCGILLTMSVLIQIRTGEPSAELAHQKEQRLFTQLRALPSVLVALSGGIDSAYLAWAAQQTVGERALAVTAISASYSKFDREQVEIFLRECGIR